MLVFEELTTETYNSELRIELDWQKAILQPVLVNAVNEGTNLLRLLAEILASHSIPTKSRKTIRWNNQIYGNRTVKDESKTRSGLSTTYSGGRKEVVQIELNEQLRRLLGRINPAYLNLPNAVTFSVKGRGSRKDNTINALHFVEKLSIKGFTGFDRNDFESVDNLSGIHQVRDLNGNIVAFNYIPPRILLAAIPINVIEVNDGAINPQEWDQPLYVEIYIDAYGFNLQDLIPIFELRDPSKTYNLLKDCLAWDPFYEDIFISAISIEKKLELLRERSIEAAWYRAQVESKYYAQSFLNNRTKQNFVVSMAEQDLDDKVPLNEQTARTVHFQYWNEVIVSYINKLKRLNNIFYSDVNSYYDSFNKIYRVVDDPMYLLDLLSANSFCPADLAVDLVNIIVSQTDDEAILVAAVKFLTNLRHYDQWVVDMLKYIRSKSARSDLLDNAICSTIISIGNPHADELIREIVHETDNLNVLITAAYATRIKPDNGPTILNSILDKSTDSKLLAEIIFVVGILKVEDAMIILTRIANLTSDSNILKAVVDKVIKLDSPLGIPLLVQIGDQHKYVSTLSVTIDEAILKMKYGNAFIMPLMAGISRLLRRTK